MTRALDPLRTYVAMSTAGACTPVDVTPSFWPDLMSGALRLDGERLVAGVESEGDWASWEMHPAGDELAVVLAGRIEFVFAGEGEDGPEEVVAAEAGQVVIIPRGRWHTARNARGFRAVFATPGEGTEHRPVRA